MVSSAVERASLAKDAISAGRARISARIARWRARASSYGIRPVSYSRMAAANSSLRIAVLCRRRWTNARRSVPMHPPPYEAPACSSHRAKLGGMCSLRVRRGRMPSVGAVAPRPCLGVVGEDARLLRERAQFRGAEGAKRREEALRLADQLVQRRGSTPRWPRVG